MGLFLKWNRHYQTTQGSIKDILFETYYYRQQYAFHVATISTDEGGNIVNPGDQLNTEIPKMLAPIGTEVQKQLESLTHALDTTSPMTLAEIRDIIKTTVPDNTGRLDSQLTEPLTDDKPLLILLTVPTHPHKEPLNWQLAAMKL